MTEHTSTHDQLEARARKRAKDLTDVIWHAGTFVIINVFLWALDVITTPGVQWAYWITITWGIGLAFHVLSWMVEGRDVEARATERYLRELEAEHSGTPDGSAT